MWTPDQVMNLAPDEASRKNAVGLANSHKWSGLAAAQWQEQHAIWGEVQGSGATPYRCQVDLNGPGYRCSCPSSKRPCKHVLGLFLLFANQPALFGDSQPPDWVADWLVKRLEQSQQREAAEAAASTTAGATPRSAGPDKDAQARRATMRDKKIRAGLDDLDIWLCDLLRQGLANAQNHPPSFWETAAARLVDAQAPGLARMVRSLGDLIVSGEGWQDRVIMQISRLYLACEGYRRVESMPQETQADLRSLVGFNLKQDDLLKQTGIRDTWLVMGRMVEEETRLIVQRVWLWGQETGRPALILSFAGPGGTLDGSLVPGMALKAELVFYPGAYPLRALIRSREAARNLPGDLPGFENLAQATGAFAAALARFPWLERLPMALNGVTPRLDNGEWAVYDEQNRRAPLAKYFLHGWTLMAMSGGTNLGVFGEWNGERLLPLSAWADGEFVAFRPTGE